MTNNSILRSIRYLLNVPDAKLAEIFALGGVDIPPELVTAFLMNETEEGYFGCDDRTMAHFLNGLIVYKRGKDESRPPPPMELPITNNIVLKKLRVAFELKDEDLHAILTAAGFTVTKPELSAFFRKPGHAHYRPCGDQFLRNFLKGLTFRVRR